MNFWPTESYTFKNQELLEQALTHSSFLNDNRQSAVSDNERLEFLGDAVLELIVSEFLYTKYPELSEGEMTKLRAAVVCEPSLAEAAKNLNIGSRIKMSKGEERTGGRERGSILSDCFEAVIGALFIDGGLTAAKKFAMDNLSGRIKACRTSFMTSDHKTHLQEQIQKWSKEPLEYLVVEETGPAHDRTFTVELSHAGIILASAQGKSKKEAEQNCAGIALERL